MRYISSQNNTTRRRHFLGRTTYERQVIFGARDEEGIHLSDVRYACETDGPNLFRFGSCPIKGIWYERLYGKHSSVLQCFVMFLKVLGALHKHNSWFDSPTSFGFFILLYKSQIQANVNEKREDLGAVNSIQTPPLHVSMFFVLLLLCRLFLPSSGPNPEIDHLSNHFTDFSSHPPTSSRHSNPPLVGSAQFRENPKTLCPTEHRVRRQTGTLGHTNHHRWTPSFFGTFLLPRRYRASHTNTNIEPNLRRAKTDANSTRYNASATSERLTVSNRLHLHPPPRPRNNNKKKTYYQPSERAPAK